MSAGLVLLYHRVAELQPDTFQLCTRPQAFREQMEHLAIHCRPVPLDGLVAASIAGHIPDRAVAVTLDDGDLDALTASAIVSEVGIPATFYLNTDCIDTPHENWYDVLERVFLCDAPLPPRLYGLERTLLAGALPPARPFVDVALRHFELSCEGAEARRATLGALNEIGFGLSADDRRALVDAIAAWSQFDLTPRPTHRLLTTPEVEKLSTRAGHSIGAHTANHLLLSAQPAAVQEEEIATSKLVLEGIIGKPVSSFAYPYGVVTPVAVEACRRLGFHSAVTVVPGRLRPGNDSLLVPRIEVKTGSITEFAALLEGHFVGAA